MAKEEFIKRDITRKQVMTKEEIEQALIDNFINLQKVMTNLSVKFDELSTNISRLLQLFEISAKTFAERYSTQEPAQDNVVDSELINKLNSLLDQNKTISKGIMLIEEKLRDKNMQEQPQPYSYQMQPYAMMQPMMLPSMQPQQFPQQNQKPPKPEVPYKKEIGERDTRPISR